LQDGSRFTWGWARDYVVMVARSLSMPIASTSVSSLMTSGRRTRGRSWCRATGGGERQLRRSRAVPSAGGSRGGPAWAEVVLEDSGWSSRSLLLNGHGDHAGADGVRADGRRLLSASITMDTSPLVDGGSDVQNVTRRVGGGGGVTGPEGAAGLSPAFSLRRVGLSA
jgi:hypothetical protein